MTTAIHPAPTRAPAGAADRIPMSRLLRVEIRKLYDTRSGKWLLASIAAITLVLMVVMLFAADAQDLTFRDISQLVAGPQAFLLPVLGVLGVTSEWSQRTGLVTFTLEPSRRRVIVAKAVAGVLVALAVGVLILVVAAVGNVVGAAMFDGDGAWNLGAGDVGEIFLLQAVNLLAGTAFGLLFLNSAAAITSYFALPIVWSIMRNLIPGLEKPGEWLDLNLTTQPLYDHTIHGGQWGKLATSFLVWVVLPLLVGAWRVMRAEIKSA